MQRLTRGPLPESLPDGWELWLDGGHNEAAGKILADGLTGWGDKPLHLVYGMLNTKEAGAFLTPLAPHTKDLHAVAIPGEKNSLSAEDAAERARTAGIESTPATSVTAAVADVLATTDRPGRILICGSLYLAGKVLADNA
jgi:dihydrofolate synthase/folylpolyglutamate synthase